MVWAFCRLHRGTTLALCTANVGLFQCFVFIYKTFIRGYGRRIRQERRISYGLSKGFYGALPTAALVSLCSAECRAEGG